MQVTSVGHAGFLIQTQSGSILCDPWVNPAYFASWFPFPDNSALDWDAIGDCDYLYVSHLHKDHFDAENLRSHVNKDAVVLLPDFPCRICEMNSRSWDFTGSSKPPTRSSTGSAGPQRSRHHDHRAAGAGRRSDR
ncbi:beta-lactamase superfamily domain protein [Mycobacterium ulcerans str. Harvey]|uniref:Beta-lactamase superfamily domain protein n=1 Tax=Mycobacterium ulcerans str. Harvey TaxID=1299332 RepID=A0ABP3A483_MYCUL|nr:beta-lactamase superfamily domain protein [Mycobacterium ulcerans str. Harvey]